MVRTNSHLDSEVGRMLAGQRRRKISAQLSGLAAEQWAHLLERARLLGLGQDEVAALLLRHGATSVDRAFDRYLKAQDPDSEKK